MVRRFSILVIILILGLIPVAINAGSGFQGGSGSVSNPYQIINAQQLYNMRTNLSANYILMANIDLSSYSNWEPIGNFNTRFNGSLNGNGYKISNLTINRPSGDYQALFGAMDPAGILKNLKLEAVNIAGGSRVGGLVGYDKGTIQDSYVVGSISGSSFVGGMVGEKSDGKINNSYTNVTIKATSDRVGGLIGSMNVGTIYRSYSLGSVTGNGIKYGGLVGHCNMVIIEECFASVNVTTSKSRVGGLIGHTEQCTIIKKSFATGNVTSTNTVANMDYEFYTGGLVGRSEGKIENCYATGAIKGHCRVGGLVGQSGNSITNSYAVGSIQALNNKELGGLIGSIFFGTAVTTGSYYDSGMSHDTGKGTAKTTAELKKLDTYVGWDFNNTWAIDSSKNNGFPYLKFATEFVGQGNGTISYEIATPEQLNAIRNNPYAHYKLVADIDLSTFGNWKSIEQFYGSLDGNGYKIKNLMNISGNSVGFIGSLQSTGRLDNIVLENINIVGGNQIGALVGYNSGFIMNCHVTGKVSGDTFVGGLIGENHKGIIYKCDTNIVVTATSDRVGGLIGSINEGTISQSYALGSVSGTGIRYGGLAGHCNRGIIDSCFASVNVTTSKNPVGGLVGQTEIGTVVRNSFATGNVTSTSRSTDADKYYSGGLIGKNKGQVWNCYATGAVTGNSCVGGLVGQSENIITNSYAIGPVTAVDKTESGGLIGKIIPATAGIKNSYYNIETSNMADNVGKGTPKTNSQMKNSSTYTGWDFNEVWTLDPSRNWGFPYLKFATLHVNAVNDGKESQISNVEQFGAIKNNRNAHYKLVADIDLSTYGNWEPLPNFFGSLDGNGYKIKNLKIEKSSTDNLGFISTLTNTGVLKNIILENVNVLGNNNVGALVGYNNGTIENSSVTGSVNGNSYVGGLIGLNNAGQIQYCHTDVTVTATGDRAGGLIGSINAGTIYRSYASGSVSGEGIRYGGLAGHCNVVTIEECYASANVTTSKNPVGGLVGHTESGTIIKNSFATGNVTSTNNGIDNKFYTGGLVGRSFGKIVNCYATGSVSGYSRVGGLVGQSENTITNCYAVGSIQAHNNDELGGLIGSIQPRTVETNNSYYDSGMANDVGKGIPKTTAELKNINTYVGWDFKEIWMLDSSKNNGFPFLKFSYSFVGQGNGGNSYEIATAQQLNAIRNNRNAHYKLVADIDLSTFGNWEPIDRLFGSLDGNGYKIKNVTINSTKDVVGFVSSLELSGVLKKITLENVTIAGESRVGALVGYNNGTVEDNGVTGKVSGVSYIGGLIGENNKGSINRCYTNVTVVATGDRVGGLIGSINEGKVSHSYALGSVSGNGIRYGGLSGHCNAAIIDACFASVKVTTRKNPVGGLVGQTELGAVVRNSFATGNVISTSYSTDIDKYYTGGLIGKNKGQVWNCYATGAVTGNSYVGGLVGQSENTITNCYAIGRVTAVDKTESGGLIGKVLPATVGIGSSYYNVETSNMVDNVGKGTPKTTAELKNSNTYVGWDFDNVWILDASKNMGYPYLRNIFSSAQDLIIKNPAPDTCLSEDTTWSGRIEIFGNLVVPVGVKLTIKPGTLIRVRDECTFLIQGTIVASDPNKGIVFDNISGNWSGLIFTASGAGTFDGVTISRAIRGVACAESGTVNLLNTTFSYNQNGLHCYSGVVNVTNCSFLDNELYGIKEDNVGNPVVKNSIFQGNGMNYYDSDLLDITVEQLNKAPNQGNEFR